MRQGYSYTDRLWQDREAAQPASLSGRLRSAWLLTQGLLTEALPDTDELVRRPSPAGEDVGIRLMEWTHDDGISFPMATLAEAAQRWVLRKLGEMDEE